MFALILMFSIAIIATPLLAENNLPKWQRQSFSLQEPKEADPLLPPMSKKRSLTPEEKLTLEKSLDELYSQAEAQLLAGNISQAFQIWNRELLLRRYLDPLAEVQALTRVGKIALARERTLEVQVISQRLQVIKLQAQSKPPIEPQLLQALGDAFVSLLAREPAVEIYQQILANAKATGDISAQIVALNTLAQLELNGLNFAKAAAAYEELIALKQKNESIQDTLDEEFYLKQLAFIYQQTKEHQKSINIRTKLIKHYLARQNPLPVPALQIAIAADYEALGRLATAAQTYQEAYTLAWSLEQFAYAAEALQKLATLLRTQNKLDEAIQVYQTLLLVEQRSFNTFGLMNIYDQLGQIYLARQAYTEALVAFQRGLDIAKQLNYQEEYFTRQIQEISQKYSP
ncbi:MAG: tetratricopeptide repeat protein [Oscillatoriaceae bacterium SKW80]|nr:tetratricopeptide repeat protein [Oscillatoriaceae bacterium SKYG93]MCX8120540.1 tetratricopeptide repeat protein [Oscillatoriaceae bacterium SKW80]MDW8452778.1 tetratricopeptide repeat protein [Oscillatoriaceae cyanobacterium SKYGB_i_bin93]